ncbi:sialate O-acetylesterase [Pedobacter arcticus]|uniref:sialate O-acetylesterase n=1 Tax=Pedobacter arcticus TaxID=752140 RepID=UPI0012B664C3|nr:sialate O-acetylesterase [Pedobacter arcticus]
MNSKKGILPFLLSLLLFTACSNSIHNKNQAVYSPKSDMDIFLFIGQSNMGGVAPIGVLDTVTLSGVLLFNGRNEWEKAKNNLGIYGGLNRYSTSNIGKKAQLSPVYTCSRKIAQVTGKSIGVVSNARGGTRISWWQKGYSGENDFDLYENAIARAKAALATKPGSKIKGIFWHQGEGDNSTQASAVYMKELTSLIADLRKDLGDNTIPFIAGEVGQWKNRGMGVNPVIRTIKQNIPYTDWVSSKGLTSINLPKNDPHFDTYSQRVFGERYADKALELIYHIKAEGLSLFSASNYEGRSVLLRQGNYSNVDLERKGIEVKEIASIRSTKSYKVQFVSSLGKVDEAKGDVPDLKLPADIVELRIIKR